MAHSSPLPDEPSRPYRRYSPEARSIYLEQRNAELERRNLALREQNLRLRAAFRWLLEITWQKCRRWLLDRVLLPLALGMGWVILVAGVAYCALLILELLLYLAVAVVFFWAQFSLPFEVAPLGPPMTSYSVYRDAGPPPAGLVHPPRFD